MSKNKILLLVAGMVMIPSIGAANDFSTLTRVHYVQDCVMTSSAKMNVYEETHKCSCVIDELAAVFTEVQFENADAGFQYRNLPGDRGAVFRDDTDVTDGISLFKKTHQEAYKTCRMR